MVVNDYEGGAFSNNICSNNSSYLDINTCRIYA